MKILIVKLGAVGDVVKALPMALAAKGLGPEVKVTWIGGRTVEPLLRSAPGIDEVVTVNEQGLLQGNLFSKLIELLKIWVRLFGRAFDVIAIAYMDPRYRLLTLTVRGGVLRTLADPGANRPGQYQGEDYVRLVTGETAERTKVPLVRLTLELPEKFKGQLGQPGDPWVALAPGGAKNILRENALRRWPVENYARLASLLASDHFRVVLTGAPSDEWVIPFFKDLPVLNLVGQTSVSDLVALYGRCALMVSHDSGPLHLAVLAGTPAVGLFGPTDPNVMIEKREGVKAIWGGEKLTCRPCYDGKNFADCNNNLCLKEVGVEQVLGEAKRMALSR